MSVDKTTLIARVFIYLLTIFFVLLTGPIMEPDSYSYLHLTIIATPGYPVFLYGFKKVLGEDYFGIVVVVVQLFFLLLSIWYFIKFLTKSLVIKNNLIIIALDIILLVSLWIPSLLIANRIVAEGLSYAVFLWMITFFIKTVLEKHRKSLLLFLASLFFALLLRSQFLFTLPPFLVIFVWFWYRDKKDFFRIISVITLILLPMLTSIVDKTFHFLVANRFENTSNTGVQLMASPFFVADPDDFTIYDNPKDQEYFKYLYTNAHKKELLDDYYKPLFNDNVYSYFHEHYVDLSYGVLSLKGREFLKNQYKDATDSDLLILNNKKLIDLAMPLIWENFSKWLLLFFYNVLHAFGSVYQLILYVLLLVLSAVAFIRHQGKIELIAMLFILLAFSNVVLVCLVEHSIDRYMLYHRWMLPVLVLLLLNEWINKSKKQPV